MKEDILKRLVAGNDPITVKYSQDKLPITIKSSKLPEIEKFTKSKIFSRRIMNLSIGDKTYLIVDGYITYKRYVDMKEVQKTRSFIIFKKTTTVFESDEEDIKKIIAKYKLIAKKGYDEKLNKSFYYIWMPAYVITDLINHEEIQHNEFKQIQRKFNKYKMALKRKLIDAKIKKIDGN